jgi:uncharacterized protein YdeI (YjbR/CyaY-like superfamily)
MTGISKDVADALGAAGLTDLFAALAPSHQNEYLRWIAEAKRPATRARRIEQAVKMLAKKGGKKPARNPRGAFARGNAEAPTGREARRGA